MRIGQSPASCSLLLATNRFHCSLAQWVGQQGPQKTFPLAQPGVVPHLSQQTAPHTHPTLPRFRLKPAPAPTSSAVCVLALGGCKGPGLPSPQGVRKGHIPARRFFFSSPTVKYAELDMYATPVEWVSREGFVYEAKVLAPPSSAVICTWVSPHQPCVVLRFSHRCHQIPFFHQRIAWNPS